MRLLDPRFSYTPSIETDIRDTLRKHGFKPTTEADRRKAQERLHGPSAKVTNINERRKS